MACVCARSSAAALQHDSLIASFSDVKLTALYMYKPLVFTRRRFQPHLVSNVFLLAEPTRSGPSKASGFCARGSSNSSLRRPSRVFARVPAIRPCLARSLPHLHGHMLTLRLHVPIQVRCRSRKALKNGRDRGKTHIADLVDSTPPAGDLSRSSGGHGHERPATPGRPTVDPLCILDPLPAHF